MHPGNIFIRDDGVLVPIDFGIMGDLNLKDRLFLARLLNAMLDRDYDAVARLHADAGMIGKDVPIEGFAQAVRAVTEPIMDKPMASVSLGAVLGQIFGLARRFQVEVQPQFNLLQKTMVMAEGVGRQLNPEANMWPIARELAEDWAKDQQGLAAQISSLADKMLMVGLRLPNFSTRLKQLLMLSSPAGAAQTHRSGKNSDLSAAGWNYCSFVYFSSQNVIYLNLLFHKL